MAACVDFVNVTWGLGGIWSSCPPPACCPVCCWGNGGRTTAAGLCSESWGILPPAGWRDGKKQADKFRKLVGMQLNEKTVHFPPHPRFTPSFVLPPVFNYNVFSALFTLYSSISIHHATTAVSKGFSANIMRPAVSMRRTAQLLMPLWWDQISFKE